METDRALGLLGLAKKGGNLQAGEENVGASSRAGHARLILLASDAADNTVRRARTFTQGGRIPCIAVPYSKAALGGALGRAVCAMAVFTDTALALAFVRALPERDEALLAELERRAERVRQRRREEKARRVNVKHGKKKS